MKVYISRLAKDIYKYIFGALIFVSVVLSIVVNWGDIKARYFDKYESIVTEEKNKTGTIGEQINGDHFIASELSGGTVDNSTSVSSNDDGKIEKQDDLVEKLSEKSNVDGKKDTVTKKSGNERVDFNIKPEKHIGSGNKIRIGVANKSYLRENAYDTSATISILELGEQIEIINESDVKGWFWVRQLKTGVCGYLNKKHFKEM